ncbi:unnamed protein product [Dibothriocephalus latus]|uniref:Uncharacterized protein n=1 Tax=Dibothriocephalus latus TaxID=60516 RepID=A0A3P6PHC8_DIBLA|nr:unnamed protein product [Dibothriocephalus latus]
MMEEFHFAGRAVDMILVDAREGSPVRQSRSLFPGKLAQLAYFKALFDWCFFSRDGYVHCSVKPVPQITRYDSHPTFSLLDKYTVLAPLIGQFDCYLFLSILRTFGLFLYPCQPEKYHT